MESTSLSIQQDKTTTEIRQPYQENSLLFFFWGGLIYAYYPPLFSIFTKHTLQKTWAIVAFIKNRHYRYLIVAFMKNAAIGFL